MISRGIARLMLAIWLRPWRERVTVFILASRISLTLCALPLRIVRILVIMFLGGCVLSRSDPQCYLDRIGNPEEGFEEGDVDWVRERLGELFECFAGPDERFSF